MKKTYKILVVDDDPILLKGTARLIENLGHEVITAGTGTDALDMVETQFPDLLLLDVDLPDISGIEVCRKIRAFDHFAGIYIVMLSTSRTGEEEQIEGLEYGLADGYIVRPLPNRVLKARIQAMLRLKAAEEDKREIEGRLIKARQFEATAKLAGGIAHDFNNLLATIMGYIEIAQMRISPDMEAYQNLRQAYAAGEQAKALTKKFLMLSKGSMANLTRQPLAPILAAMVKQLTSDYPWMRTELKMPENLPAVYIDDSQILLAFESIINNAIEAMDEKAGSRLTVAAQDIQLHGRDIFTDMELQPHRYVELKFTDTGRGIKQETLHQVFDPYFSTKRMGVQKGMGLGLTIAYAVARRHGGTIIIDSQPGQGATCFMYLPTSG